MTRRPATGLTIHDAMQARIDRIRRALHRLDELAAVNFKLDDLNNPGFDALVAVRTLLELLEDATDYFEARDAD